MVVKAADHNDNMFKEDAKGSSILIFSAYLPGDWEPQWLGLGMFFLFVKLTTNKSTKFS